MRLSEEYIQTVKDANDIYDVMSSYVPLKRTGSDYVCCCPFHSEKTPSCHVYMSTQSFYCFGCHAAGDVINFIRLYEHIDYRESVSFLAQRAGLPLPEDENTEESRFRIRIYEMNREAGKFFHKMLFSEKGKAGLDYLYGRNLTTHTIRLHGLGYAPDDWSALRRYLNNLGYSDAELEAASLATKSSRSGNYFDFFKNRVMFPFFDLRGNIVGFSGRDIGGEDPRKYLNTKGTAVYNKSTFLYGLNHAKKSGLTSLILCEGNLDVIALQQAGFKNSVATCGTAITDSHARVIANQGFKEVLLAYDSDDAGQKATSKALNILDKVGITARIITMNNAKDPDEYIKAFGKEAFQTLIDRAKGGVLFELDKIKRTVDLSTPEGKSEYLKRSVAFIAQINNTIDRTVYISEVAQLCGVNSGNITEAVEQQRRRNFRNNEKRERDELISGRGNVDRLNPDSVRYPKETLAERGIIAFLMYSPDYCEYILDKITSDCFPTEFNRKLFENAVEVIKNGENADVSVLGQMYSAQEVSAIAGIAAEGGRLPYSRERLDDYIEILQKHKQSANRKNVSEMTAEELLEYADRIRQGKK